MTFKTAESMRPLLRPDSRGVGPCACRRKGADSETGRDGGREGWTEAGREGGRQGGREAGRETKREREI